MEINEEKLRELSQEYEMSFKHISRIYNLVKDIPLIIDRTKDEFLEFFELLIQDRVSISFISNTKGFDAIHYKTLEYSISDALYKVYGDEALPYLSEEYIYENDSRYILKRDFD